MRFLRIWLVVCSVLLNSGLTGAIAKDRMSAFEFNAKETGDYFRGLNQIAYAGWGDLNSKVLGIAEELFQYSGKRFHVVPGQTFQLGHAQVGGWIIIDLSTAVKEKSVLAFALAHEWGHEVLGHPDNLAKVNGQFRFLSSRTKDEDDADTYAAKFLANRGYPLGPVVEFLETSPAVGIFDAHSDGPTRAENLKKHFDAFASRDNSLGATKNETSETSSSSSSSMLPTSKGGYQCALDCIDLENACVKAKVGETGRRSSSYWKECREECKGYCKTLDPVFVPNLSKEFPLLMEALLKASKNSFAAVRLGTRHLKCDRGDSCWDANFKLPGFERCEVLATVDDGVYTCETLFTMSLAHAFEYRKRLVGLALAGLGNGWKLDSAVDDPEREKIVNPDKGLEITFDTDTLGTGTEPDATYGIEIMFFKFKNRKLPSP